PGPELGPRARPETVLSWGNRSPARRGEVCPARPTRHASITGMAADDARVTPATERYPGEALDLLRQIHADVAELRRRLDEFGPVLDTLRTSGVLGVLRAGRRAARNGAPPDDYPAPGTRGPGPGYPTSGIFQRRTRGPGHPAGPGRGAQ